MWIALLLTLLLPLVAAAAPVPIAKDVFVQRDRYDPGRQPDGNSVIFVGPAGLVVVDSGRHVEHTQALLDFAAAQAQPIVAVINSHWHLDHLGGNALLRDQMPGLQVVASSAVAPALQGWLAQSRREMQALLDSGSADAATQAMLRVDIALIARGPRLLPDIALDGPRAMTLAGLPLRIGYQSHAVTAGDLWVYEPSTQVLAAGDLVTLPVPFLDTACTGGWRAALGQLEAVPFETLVPGHGAPMNRAQFVVWRQAFEGLLSCTAGTGPAAACSDAWISTLGDLLPAAEHARARDMLAYYLAQHLRAPRAQRDRYC